MFDSFDRHKFSELVGGKFADRCLISTEEEFHNLQTSPEGL